MTEQEYKIIAMWEFNLEFSETFRPECRVQGNSFPAG